MPHIINLDEREPFTYSSWRELIERAQTAVVPYYGIAISYVRNPQTNRSVKKIYDAISFDRHLTVSTRDPLTNLEIKKVEYRFCKMYQFDTKSNKLVINKDNFDFRPVFLGKFYSHPSFVFEANNYFAKEKDTYKVALCQYLFGLYLLKKSSESRRAITPCREEALRWLHIAAQGGCQPATQLLKKKYN